MRSLSLLTCLAAVVQLAACGSGDDHPPRATGYAAIEAGVPADGSTDAAGVICNGSLCNCPDGMVQMPTQALGGGRYCIDAHEVTTAAYNTFWLAGVSSTTQPSQCRWNTNWTPSQAWPPAAADTHPVRYVDWCDAYAYCKWAGKTLCGRIGGGSNAPAALADPEKSAWFNACSAEGTNTYPNGAAFDSSACNGQSAKSDVWAASVTSCQGGTTGLFDMSGNVQEWEDSCDASDAAGDNCLVRGGAWDTTDPSLLTCAAATTLPRNAQTADTGFRCCEFIR